MLEIDIPPRGLLRLEYLVLDVNGTIALDGQLRLSVAPLKMATFRNAPTEEVVAACIRQAAGCYEPKEPFLVAAGKELASLLKDDYDRLQAIMRRVAG